MINQKKIAIIGAGDLGRQIAHYIKTDGNDLVIGFIDDTYDNEEQIDEIPIIGKIDEIEFLFKNKLFSHLLLGIGYNHMRFRKNCFESFKDIPFATFVHSTVIKDPTATIKKGSVIFPGCLLDRGVTIQENVLLNVHTTISHDSSIGAHSFISPRVAIAGFVNVGDCCFIGINCTVIDNININEYSKLGGGALVINDIRNPGLYVGAPAKLKRK